MKLAELNYFEDLQVGDAWTTPAITITEGHIGAFAGLTGDFSDLHVDEDFAHGMGFPGRVAHGLLGLGLIDGLKNRSGVRFAVVAALNWNWRFSGPLYIGDRLHAELEIAALRRTSRGDRGIVTLHIAGRNQHGQAVQEGENQIMVLCREPAAAGG
ncbi:MaoC family dehydratase [Bordetella sp. 2513F-2]